jgi:fibronectin-binding autotransporter adhesin
VAESVTKAGAGTLVLDGAAGYAGSTTVAAGTLEVAVDEALAGSSGVTVGSGATLALAAGVTLRSPRVSLEGGTLAGGSVAVNGTTGIETLAINSGSLSGETSLLVGPGGLVELPASARVTLGVAGLGVDDASGGGRVDLGAGEFAIAAGGMTEAELVADLVAGRGDGSWNGTSGITSSVAAGSTGTRAVGYLADGSGGFRVSLAAPGDTNLDGVVDLLDLLGILGSGSYETAVASDWNRGDFNYDGVTDLLDLLGILGSGTYDQGSYFADPPVAATSLVPAVVPEPSTWLVAACGLAGLIAARRKAHRAGR